MVKTEMYMIKRKITYDDLNRLIRTLERSTRFLKKLLFIRYRYDGDSVETAAGRIGITKMMGYLWQKKWNVEGYKGLIPRYARKGPSKMSPDQKAALKEELMHDQYTTAQVRDIIRKEYGIEYTMKQAWVILKKMGMRHARPYPHDKTRPRNAGNIKKKLRQGIMHESIIGFLDESAPQTTANTVMLWSFSKPELIKDTSKMR